MRLTRLVQQVHGILAMHGVFPDRLRDSHELLIEVPDGSSVVFIGFDDWHGDTIVSLSAHVLEELELDSQKRRQLLERLNELNGRSRFGRFHFDHEQRTIHLRYEILGDNLDADELLGALTTIGRLADDVDDQLMDELGTGKRAVDMADKWRAHREPLRSGVWDTPHQRPSPHPDARGRDIQGPDA